MHRTRDPALFNALANRPHIRATFAHHMPADEVFDFGPMIADDRNIFLSNGVDACSFYTPIGPVVYDGHSLTDTTCRGRRAIEAGRQSLAWFWSHTDAELVTGSTPIELKAARWFNRQMGFVSAGRYLRRGHLGDYWCEGFYAARPPV
jgi:hypothetical protein